MGWLSPVVDEDGSGALIGGMFHAQVNQTVEGNVTAT